MTQKKPSKNNKQLQDVNPEDLIFDDMDMDDEFSETNADSALDSLGSLDEMESWLNQQQSNTGAKVQRTDFGAPTPTASDETANEDWLKDLLDDKPKQSATTNESNASTSSTPNVQQDDLSNLLSDYGIESEVIEEPSKSKILDNIHDKVVNHDTVPHTMRDKRSPIPFILWTLGSLLMIALMFIQYVIFNVDNLLVNQKYAPKLHQACDIISCQLPGVDIKNIGITANHRASDVEPKSTHSDLLLAISNLGNQEQLYPNLKITLLNGAQITGEIVAKPSDYLTIKQNYMGSQQTKIVMLTIAVPHEQISDVKIDPFY